MQSFGNCNQYYFFCFEARERHACLRVVGAISSRSRKRGVFFAVKVQLILRSPYHNMKSNRTLYKMNAPFQKIYIRMLLTGPSNTAGDSMHWKRRGSGASEEESKERED